MGDYTHFNKVSGVKGLAVGSEGNEKVIADELGRMYLNFAPGSQFYVDGTNGSATGDGLTWATAVTTITLALAKCTANKGDVIFVAPWHTQTISAAAGIVFNKAGVTVIGLGFGTLRPTITLGTANTADMDVTADNTFLKNFAFVADFADIAKCFDVTAKGFDIEGVEFRDSEVDKNFVQYINCPGANNTADRLSVRRCTAISPDIANKQFIYTVNDIDRLTVEDCFTMLGLNNGQAVIQAATGKDFTNVLIRNNAFNRLNTANVTAMYSDTADNSGMIYNNFVGTADADAATPWDVTGARLFNNYQVGVVDASGLLLPAVDDDA